MGIERLGISNYGNVFSRENNIFFLHDMHLDKRYGIWV